MEKNLGNSFVLGPITNAEIFYKTYFEAFLLKIGDVNCTGIYKYTKNIKGISIQLFSRTV